MKHEKSTNLVIGAGAVGTVLAAYLVRSGQTVQIQVRPEKLAQMRALQRLQVVDAKGALLIDEPAPAIVAGETVADADHIFLCSKRAGLAPLLRSIEPSLAHSTVLLPCINGVGLTEAVHSVTPQNPAAPVTIMFNARMDSPLRARLTTRAELLIDTGTHGEHAPLLKLFSDPGMKASAAEDGTQWGKLLINLNNAICALTHRTFSDLFGGQSALMQCFILVLDEAVGILERAGVAYTMPAPVPYPVYRFLLKHGRGLPLWIARRKNGLTDQAHPSMRADLEQGRTTEVEYLNGAIVALAESQGETAPVNAKLVELVREREADPAATDWSPDALLRALESAPTAVPKS